MKEILIAVVSAAVTAPISIICTSIYEKRKFRDQNAEKATVSTHWGYGQGKDYPYWSVIVCNYGQVPIYLRTVALGWGNEEDHEGRVEIELVPVCGAPFPLMPGDDCSYELQLVNTVLLRHALDAPISSLRLRVTSAKGDVHVISGDDVRRQVGALLEFAESYQAHNEQRQQNPKQEDPVPPSACSPGQDVP